jgi:uncharacterized membrane protein YqhA
MKKIERLFEGFLWSSRLIVLVAVVFSLISSIAMFYLTTVDAWFMLLHLSDYISSDLGVVEREALRTDTIAHVVGTIDGYLLATVLLIFSLGLYELFISKIDMAEKSETVSKVLFIKDLDELKARLGKVVLMMLIVKFFEHALGMHFKSPLDLLAFAAGITLIGLALYLSHGAEHSHDDDHKKNECT